MYLKMEQDHEFRFHPHNVLLTLLLAGLSMLFLALSAAYLYSRIQQNLPPIRLPWLFFSNTLILISSSWTLIRSEKAYLEDDTSGYRRYLSGTLALSLIFLGLQVIAWGQLFQEQLFINSDLSTSYVYALSILHFLHVVGGIPFLSSFTWTAFRRMKEPVSVLVYFSDSSKRRRLKLLGKYWHFLDILWIYLMLFLGVNMLF